MAATTPRKTTTTRRAPASTIKLDALAGSVEKLRTLQARIARLKADCAPLIAEIKGKMGESPQGTIGGIVVARWSTTARRDVSVKLVREKDPALAEACTVITTVRKFEILDPTEA